MSAISTDINKIRNAVWADEVRESIAHGIEQCYSDVSNPTLQTDALEAALQAKIDEGEMAALTIGDGTITTAKIANGAITQAKLDPNISFEADGELDATSTNAIQNKVVAQAIGEVNESLAQNTFPNGAKMALLNCLEHLVWTDDDGLTYINALKMALHILPVSIDAVYTQAHTVYSTTSLNSLKADLVVIGTYSDGSTETLASSDYELSGTLTTGTSTITVIAGSATDTFIVTVSEESAPALYNWDLTTSLTDSVSGNVATLTNAERTNSGVVFNQVQGEIGLGNVLAFNRTVEIDVDNFTFAGTTDYNIRFAMWGSQRNNGIVWRHGSVIGWSAYFGTWNPTALIEGSSDNVINYFNGKTVGIYISSDGHVSLYVDGTLIGTTSITEQSSVLTGSWFRIGSSDSIQLGGQFYNATVSGVRIYEGNIYA